MVIDPTKFAFNEGALMTKILYKPLFNILILLYIYLPIQDLGLAIITLTFIIRLALFPSYVKTLKSQQALKKIQPHIDKIKELHKDDKTKQSQELMKLYKEHKVNPLSSCLPLLIQLPILFALYRVFIFGLTTDSLVHLYAWFPKVPEVLNTTFLAFTNIPAIQIDLTAPNLYLAIIAGVVQLAQSWLMTKFQPIPKGGGMASIMSKQMLYFFPIFTIFIAMSLPAALALYWVATTFFMAIQQLIVINSLNKKPTNDNEPASN